MYQEYAIDPTTICRSFDRFKLVWTGLGYAEGRLLCRFPGSWPKKVLKSDAYEELSDGQKKQIEEHLAREKFSTQKMIPSGREFDSNSPTWLEAAECAHHRRPLHSVLAEDNPRHQDFVTRFDDVGEPDDCWATEKPWHVRRWHTDMAAAAAPLLRNSREILFVEPYFKFSRRFTRPLRNFLAEVVPYAGTIKRIEVHLKLWDDESNEELFCETFEGNLRDQLHYCHPRNGDSLLQKLEFFIWESPNHDRMHPRYILTELAGLGFENGLDESDDGYAITDVSPIAGTPLQTRWAEFQEAESSRRLIQRLKASDILN